MGTTLKRFGIRVRTLRQEQGLSQEELADKVGLHYTYIGSVERGEANPTLKNIEKIASALKIGLPELFSFYVAKESSEPFARIRGQLFNLVKDEDLKTSRNIVKILRGILSLR